MFFQNSLMDHTTSNPADPQGKKKRPGTVYLIGLAVFFFFLLKLFVLDVKIVQGYSMSPTFEPGDIIFINRLAFGITMPVTRHQLVMWSVPKPSDVVLFMEPGSNRNVIKRCAGLPGDPLTVTPQALILRNRVIALTEDQYSVIEGWNTVPEDTVFFIGDNFWRSKDSRNYGFVPYNRLQGKVLTRR